MLNLFIPLAAVFAAAAAAQQSGPRLLNLPELVTSNDYPAISIDQEQEGVATVRLEVDRNGFVAACTIAVSSGHKALDEQTCALYRARARFEPARDARGQAVASEYTQRVTWKLEGDPPVPMPRQAWMTRSTIGFSESGAIVNCKTEAAGLAFVPKDCEDIQSFAAAESIANKNGEPVVRFAIAETYFYPVPADKAVTPPLLRDAKQLAQQVSEVVIGPDGRVIQCRGTRYSGLADPESDACEVVRNNRFIPASGGANFVATVVMTLYERTNTVT